MRVTLENVEPPANISICCGQLSVLIVLILYQFLTIFDPVERNKFAYMALGEIGDDYLYEELQDRVLDIVGDVGLSVAPVIPTCHFEGAAPMEAISPNHNDGKFLESVKSDALLNLDNAYRIL